MKNSIKSLLIAVTLWALPTTAHSADTLFVKESQLPVLIERTDNIMFYLRIDAQQGQTLSDVVLKFGKEVNLANVQAVKFYYAGTEALQNQGKGHFAPVQYISSHNIKNTLSANSSYSLLKSEIKAPKNEVVFKGEQKMIVGENFFWVSLQMRPNTPISDVVTASIVSAKVDNRVAIVELVSPQNIAHRMGVGVRHAGNDSSASFRIPGLVTTNNGTLLGVYDVRYNNSADLQEWVDIGLSRSTDGGQTWERMTLPMSFGEFGGLPKSQNGVGDPAILVDTKTNTVWIVAAWTHAMGNQRAWWSSHPGNSIQTTAQLVMAKSTDDGKTWSEPINITDQVKDSSWYFLLQGPGRGITMESGTLVFPAQFIDAKRVPNACIMYSEDRGENWKLHKLARTNTTEAQVVELTPGELMLNIRDNRGGSRAVMTTEDMGKTWANHPSSRKALQESVCQASLISVKAKDNVLGRDILIFSNPNTTKGRHSMTIKISFDGGNTWPQDAQLMLDEGGSWGYSCLSMVDSETVGILYESSVAHMTFQAVKLKDIVK